MVEPGGDDSLRERLEALIRSVDQQARRAADPVALAHRHPSPRDAEIAGLIAALLAFGRVAALQPWLEQLSGAFERLGGPRRFVETFEPARSAPELAGFSYRWVREIDLVLLFGALRRVVEERGAVEALFDGYTPAHHTTRQALTIAVDRLRGHAEVVATELGLGPLLPYGTRYLLCSPRGGSACKRWNLYLRWMVRPADGVDLGLWSSLPPRALVVPLDTHLLRIARYLGLTRRSDASWRTAEEITASLRLLDPDDPVRYDFAIAHLGISGACRAGADPTRCARCVLSGSCRAATT